MDQKIFYIVDIALVLKSRAPTWFIDHLNFSIWIYTKNTQTLNSMHTLNRQAATIEGEVHKIKRWRPCESTTSALNGFESKLTAHKGQLLRPNFSAFDPSRLKSLWQYTR